MNERSDREGDSTFARRGSLLKSRGIAALTLLLALDCAIFHSPLYSQWVKPHSYAGALVQRCSLAQAKEKPDARLVALVGDSRIREGFSAKLFDQMAAEKSLPDRALNLGVSGSTLRVWYYLLKHVDPHCRAFDTIVVALPSFWDEDYSPDLSNNKLDLQIALPILQMTDVPVFLTSFEDYNARIEVLLGSLFKMYGYRRDLRNFLAHPKDRIVEVDDSNKYWEQRDYDYNGDNNSLAGLKVVNDRVVNVPTFLEQAKLDRLKMVIFPGPPHPDFRKWHYLRYWTDRLVERYRNSPTKIVILCIPNNPVPVQRTRPQIHTTVAFLSKKPNVRVLPIAKFSSLNKPEYFYDDIHLNRIGRQKFTQMLSTELFDSSVVVTSAALNR
jgi:hypothetical protein